MASLKSRHAVMTLSGSTETLTASASASTGVTFSGGGVRWLSIQPGAANANPIYIGGPSVSSTDYGTRLPAASGGVPPPPHVIAEFEDGTLTTNEIYVIGTAAEKLHIHYITFL